MVCIDYYMLLVAELEGCDGCVFTLIFAKPYVVHLLFYQNTRNGCYFLAPRHISPIPSTPQLGSALSSYFLLNRPNNIRITILYPNQAKPCVVFCVEQATWNRLFLDHDNVPPPKERLHWIMIMCPPQGETTCGLLSKWTSTIKIQLSMWSNIKQTPLSSHHNVLTMTDLKKNSLL